MNDLPQYELIGAYLDGELDAAEAAQVERLLAEDPAARRMLDEFRALGAVLKSSLPHESLETDLSDEVLATAERRLLDPDAAETDAPAYPPDAAPWPRRLLNPRIWVWSGVAAALAVAIAIGDRRQNPQPAAEPPRDLARATDSRTKDKGVESEIADRQYKNKAGESEIADQHDNNKGDSRPTMQAAPPPDAERRIAAAPRKAVADALREDQAGMDSPPGSITPPAVQSTRENMAQESLFAARPRQGRGEQSRVPAPSATPAAPAPEPAARGKAGAGSDAGGFHAPEEWNDYEDQTAGQKQAKPKAVAAPPGVMVVHCDISPRAAKSRALDKLLTANGISWRVEPSGKGQPGPRDFAAAQPSDGKAEEKDRPKAAEKPPQRKSIGVERKDADADDEAAEMIFAEATDAQLRAALAGLSAQPEVFLSFSIQRSRPLNERPESMHRAESAPRQPTQPMAKAPSGGTPPPPAEAEPPGLAELPQTAQNVALRRVLFVLRVVESDQPPVAAKIAPAEKSQQAEQSPAAPSPAEEKPLPAQK